MSNIIIYNTNKEWYSRWYYIFENKTSGKLYLGQTKGNIEMYCGSGKYWINHCKKYGGLNRNNIIAIWTKFFEEEESAKMFLTDFEKEYPDYWLNKNTEWANLVQENTESSPGCGGNLEIIEKMKETKLRNKKPLTVEQLARKKEAMNRPEVKEKLRINSSKKFGKENHSSKQVIINGITYDTMKAAHKETGLSLHYIREHYIKNVVKQKLTTEELLKRFEQRSQISKKIWESEEYRINRKNSVNKAWTNVKRKIQSEKLKEKWTEEEYRFNWKSSINKYWDNEENRLACKERNKRAWEDADERRKTVSDKIKELWKTEEFREKQINKKMPKAETHYSFKGYYITPFGKFTSPDAQDILHRNNLYRWCRQRSDMLISNSAYIGSKWLQENYSKEEIVNKKTFRELGFWFDSTDSSSHQNYY